MNVKMNIDIEPDFSHKPLTASTTGRNGSKSLSRGFRPNSSSQFFSPTTTNTPGGTRPISQQYPRRNVDSKTNLEDEEDLETGEYQYSNLRNEIMKLLSGEEPKPKRMIKSATMAGGSYKRPSSISSQPKPVTDFNIRPSTVSGARKLGNDVIQSAYAQRRPPTKYQLKKFNDIFEESSFENGEGLEEHLLKNDLNKIRQNEGGE
jgi:hypothetical protein